MMKYLFVLFVVVGMARAELPVGSSPAALKFEHFPTPVHAFVFRNWNLVETGRLAKILKTTPEKIREMAGEMGLPAEEVVPEIYRSRLYLSLIRRNWHLLPYEQLLELLEMTPQQLEYTLREDDFLWVKLGMLKPKCERLVWKEPSAATRKRCGEIRELIRKEFGAAMGGPVEKRFAFLEEFQKPVAGPVAHRAAADAPLRLIYSYFAVYGDPLSDPTLDPYPDGLLARLAEMGVNGVWLHAVLRQLAPDPAFAEFGEGSEKRLAELRKLVERARRFGIGVYLYINEPRAMPAAFFKDRAEMAGVREGEYVAMCTSNPLVRRWMEDALAHVFSSAPNLGGVFTISASENLTNCASHGQHRTCPHCKGRSAAAIIAEVNATIEAGVHRGNAEARVLVWDWGWNDGDAAEIIRSLPKSVWLMSVSEWSIPITRGGVSTAVGEYSISTVGPGPRAMGHWKMAREAGLKTVAKIQANNSWELSAVPALPVLDLVGEHAEKLGEAKIDGMMLSWTLGGYPSANLDLLRRFDAMPRPTKEDVMGSLARDRFGEGAEHARKAWKGFSEAFAEYPFDGNVIYNAPVQLGPANLLFSKPTGYAATMVGIPYDDVKRWSGPYPPEVLAGQYEKVAGGFKGALEDLALGVEKTPGEKMAVAQGELGVARAARIHFQSVANQVRFVLARDSGAGAEQVAKMRKLMRDEAELAKELFVLTREDSRIGFEASNQYYYLPQDLMEKVINCDYIARHLQ
ncbi:MAG TPA: hypothetical protein VGQ99_04085, partial [Tepidisphaeraceae bacterium]|nr:hypothetical protein [Tepidisphaeraceae bacterium]